MIGQKVYPMDNSQAHAIDDYTHNPMFAKMNSRGYCIPVTIVSEPYELWFPRGWDRTYACYTFITVECMGMLYRIVNNYYTEDEYIEEVNRPRFIDYMS